METAKNKITDALLGVAIGDAVGVPFEFSSRVKMQIKPATDMVGYGTYNQPAGTWSDDSSLTFCLAESLINGYDLKDIAKKFIKWKNEAYWAARGDVFDIGMTTSKAISNLQNIIKNNNFSKLTKLKYYANEYDNGNGSLMRIIPLLFFIKGKPLKEQFEIVWDVSALTHRHIRAAMSCMIYLNFAEKLLNGQEKDEAYNQTRTEILNFWDEINFDQAERSHFEKIIQNDIRDTRKKDLKSGGYVIEVLEAAFWFFLNKNSFADTILSIINIGHDTDTSAAIVGGLAGIYYGQEQMPEKWKNLLARKTDIIKLSNKLFEKYCNKN